MSEHPSPDNYKINGQFGRDREVQNQQFGANVKYSFALGRAAIPQQLVDKKLNSPGAGTYVPEKTFGKQGEMRSFGTRPKYPNYMLRKKASLPGPGEYLHADVLSDKIVSSLNQNSVGQKIPKAKDRFYTPLNRRVEPAPDQYSPKTTMRDD